MNNQEALDFIQRHILSIPSMNNVFIHSVTPKKDYNIATIYGGDNWNGTWTNYINQIKVILDFIPNSWIINLENDCLDDVWTLTIGFTKLS